MTMFLLACLAWAKERPPNVILILADDLGYGDLGCFGQKTLKTPRLDKMAAEGMKFTQFYAGCTVCAPSRSVLLTGRHMGRTVVRGNSAQPIIIKPGQPTLASVLKKAGYATACVGKWGVGTPDNFTNPNDVGFDHFYGYVNMWHAHNFYPEFLIRNGKVFPLKNVVAEKWRRWQDPRLPQAGRGVAVKKVEYAPDLLIEDALRFIRENHKKPFFLYFAMNVPHANNEAGNKGMEVPELGKFASKDWPEPEKGFAAMIQNIDRDTGRVLDLLEELRIEKDTLVLFTSDNGPHQEGGHRADFFDSNGPLRGTKRDLTEGGIRVPTIGWWPGTIEAGTDNEHISAFWDILPTYCDLAGIKAPKKTDGISFAPSLRGESQEAHEYLYWEFHAQGGKQAVRKGKWKGIRKNINKNPEGPILLYNLDEDIGETKNIAAQHPEITRDLSRIMAEAHEPNPRFQFPQDKK